MSDTLGLLSLPEGGRFRLNDIACQRVRDDTRAAIPHICRAWGNFTIATICDDEANVLAAVKLKGFLVQHGHHRDFMIDFLLRAHLTGLLVLQDRVFAYLQLRFGVDMQFEYVIDHCRLRRSWRTTTTTTALFTLAMNTTSIYVMGLFRLLRLLFLLLLLLLLGGKSIKFVRAIVDLEHRALITSLCLAGKRGNARIPRRQIFDGPLLTDHVDHGKPKLLLLRLLLLHFYEIVVV